MRLMNKFGFVFWCQVRVGLRNGRNQGVGLDAAFTSKTVYKSAELFVFKFHQMTDLEAVFGIIIHIQKPDLDKELMTLTFNSQVA